MQYFALHGASLAHWLSENDACDRFVVRAEANRSNHSAAMFRTAAILTSLWPVQRPTKAMTQRPTAKRREEGGPRMMAAKDAAAAAAFHRRESLSEAQAVPLSERISDPDAARPSKPM